MKNLPALLSLLLFSYFYGYSNPLNEVLNGYNYRLSNNYILNRPTSTTEQIRMNLYGFSPDGSTHVLDGTLTQYAPAFSNNIDASDSRKLYNSGENISMMRGNYNLIIERRETIVLSDSIFFRMWGMQKKSYRMEFIARELNHPGLIGYLEDNYLHSSIPINLNDTTRITITINNAAASYAQDRFRIIFKTVDLFTAMPFGFTVVNAYPQNEQISVNWKTVNENNMKQYFVERSLDGVVFTDMAAINAYNLSSNSYIWTDHYPIGENNYYRIRSVGQNGEIQYSNIVKVTVMAKVKVNEPGKSIEGSGCISLFPNPAVANNLNLKITNQQAGLYKVRMINSYGLPLMLQSFNYGGGNSIEKLMVTKNIPQGIYHLEITNPDGKKQVIHLVF